MMTSMKTKKKKEKKQEDDGIKAEIDLQKLTEKIN